MEQIVVGVFENRSEVERAKQGLLSGGFSSSVIDVHAEDTSRPNATSVAEDRQESGIVRFFRSLFGNEKHRDTATLYGEAVRRGHCVLTVHVTQPQEADRAQEIMEDAGAIDVDERGAQWDNRGGLTGARSLRTDTDTRRSNVASPSNEGATAGKKTTIPVVEEELRVGKRTVNRGGVRVFARMSDRPVEETVQLRQEKATVERRPANRPATEADLATFKDGAIEVRETVEEAVVNKRARVVEEVVVGKETTQREEKIRDSVRHTDVQVDRVDNQRTAADTTTNSRDGFSDDDDADYRAHWQANYAKSGGRYEDYAPAYGYGSELRSSGRYEGRSWDDVEPDARRDWESRYPDSAWERFKESVRHGWERLTGSAGARAPRTDRPGRRPTA